MKALYYVGEKEMELREIPIPVPNENEYLIQVKSNGICGSDFEGYMGKTGRRTPPMIMGHEFSGVVSKAPKGGNFRKARKWLFSRSPTAVFVNSARRVW